MTSETKADKLPWQPRVDRQPELNPFENEAEPSKVLDDLPLLDDLEPEPTAVDVPP